MTLLTVTGLKIILCKNEIMSFPLPGVAKADGAAAHVLSGIQEVLKAAG